MGSCTASPYVLDARRYTASACAEDPCAGAASGTLPLMAGDVTPGTLHPDEAVKPKKRSGRRRILGAVAALVVIVAVFVNVLPRIADYADVVDVVSGLTPGAIALLIVVAVLNVATFPPPWMAALPGLGYWQGFVLTQTST